ncbi:MAG TPA: hypothetical protein VIL85_24930 [Thermomicrobiales bacterium]|jgi:hypothetical protein
MPSTSKRKCRTTLTPEEWYPGFLALLAQTGMVRLTCQQVGIARRTAYRHRRANPAFAEAWALAMEDAGDALEAEARRRALLGVETRRLILYKGKPVIDRSRPGRWADGQGNDWIEGVSQGRKCWTGAFLYAVEMRYSDGLLALLLKAAKPERYAARPRIDQGAVIKEAERVAAVLGVPLDALLAEARALQAGG